MSDDNPIVRIPFHGDELYTLNIDGKPHVILTPALTALGLDPWAQITKLRSRSWARTGQRLVQMPGDDQRRQVVTCDVRTFLMLLATIDERRVADDVREKLKNYQSEVADAIESYWTQGGAINPRATEDQLAAVIDRATRQAEGLRALIGIVDPRWLESKGRHLGARMLGEEPEEDHSARPITVGEYLDEQGVTATAARKLSSRFGKMLKARYVARHGEPPGKSRRFVDGAQRDVAVYTEVDRDLFDAVWNDLTDDAAA